MTQVSEALAVVKVDGHNVCRDCGDTVCLAEEGLRVPADAWVHDWNLGTECHPEGGTRTMLDGSGRAICVRRLAVVLKRQRQDGTFTSRHRCSKPGCETPPAWVAYSLRDLPLWAACDGHLDEMVVGVTCHVPPDA